MLKWKNLLFVAGCAIVLVVLLMAPKETTKRTPADETHKNPKQYEGCPKCHIGGGDGPAAPADHAKNGQLLPDHVKCYMCHKAAK